MAHTVHATSTSRSPSRLASSLGVVLPPKGYAPRAHQRYRAADDPQGRHAAALDDRAEQAGEHGEYREDERAVQRVGHVLAEGEHEREADVGGEGREGEKASLLAAGEAASGA